ncbi:hypothetical protein BAME_11970 [Bacillus sp. M 2-6]|nr:hypothetical protein BAME_11970 [Bacillus sp. M 2-6]
MLPDMKTKKLAERQSSTQMFVLLFFGAVTWIILYLIRVI